jgi:uncharacterized membrane-anchored protein
VSDTPETDGLARGNHVVPTEWAEQLERERDEARDTVEKLTQQGLTLMDENRSLKRQKKNNEGGK